MRRFVRNLVSLAASVGALAGLPSSLPAHARDLSAKTRHPADQYEYVVQVPNTFNYGYNPEVREDRHRLALRQIRPYCRRGRVV